MAIDFMPPDFVANNDPYVIQQRMMEMLPSDIDNMPGGFPWDFTMPTAMEKAQLIQFQLVQTLMLMFPMWAWGHWLDYHATAAGIKRKEANYSSGILFIVGIVGTKIQKGTIFATSATNEKASIEFLATADYVVPESGELEISVVAKEVGKNSNVLAGTVNLMSKPIKGIKSITNSSNFTGGTEVEDDESLRERIQETNENINASFVGNDADYIRWTKEIVGVGTATIMAEWNGPGTVKIIVIDANGHPANEQMLTDVYDYIVSPKDQAQRLAPIGAIVTVVSPSIIQISYSGTIVVKYGFTLEQVETLFKAKLIEYYKEAREAGELKYNMIAAILANLSGVQDFSDFQIRNDIKNIVLKKEEYPETGNIEFTALEETV